MKPGLNGRLHRPDSSKPFFPRSRYNSQMLTFFLVGFMASGKSTLARMLAERCHLQAIDLDQVIEAASGESAGEIIWRRGEAVFRELEYRTLRACPGNAVIAGGGGCFLSVDVRAYLRDSGIRSIFLDVPWEVLRERAWAQPLDRPFWVDDERARALFEARLPTYRESDFILSMSGSEAPSDIVKLLLEKIPELQCAI